MNTLYAAVLVASLSIFLAAADPDQSVVTKPRIVEHKSFTVIGIQVRTNNSREASGQGKIPKQWDTFFKDNVLAKIPSKADSNIVVVYSNYQSDYKGDYDYLIGAKVNDASNIPGMVLQTVPNGRYAVLTTPSGQVGKVVSETWRKIWALEDHAKLGSPRAYKKDFEIYDDRARDPNKSHVDIYVGLK